MDSLTGIGIGHVEISISDIYNGTVYRQSTSNAEGGFVIEVPASQRVEMGIFHEKYKGKTLSFDEITTLHTREKPSILLQGEGSDAAHNLSIRAVSINNVKISSAFLTIRNETSGKITEKCITEAEGNHCNLQLTHGQTYEITLQADGYFERKWSFVWDERRLDRDDVDWDFFKSEDIFTKTNDTDHLWEIQLWPNSLNAHIELRDIDYSPGESYILPKTVKVLDKLMLFLNRNSGVVFEMQHHSNDWGDSQRDLLFSKRRAQGLVDYLTERWDLPTDQLAVQGMGHGLLDKSCKGAIQCERKTEDLHTHTKTTLKVIAYNHKSPNIQQGGYYDHNMDTTKDR